MSVLNVFRKSHQPVEELDFKIYFKDGFLEYIKGCKGFHSDCELADALEITDSYLSQLRNRKKSVSAEIIIRVAEILNNIEGNWQNPFVIVPVGPKLPLNHPHYNEEKYQGKVPYSPYSRSAELREKDFQINC